MAYLWVWTLAETHSSVGGGVFPRDGGNEGFSAAASVLLLWDAGTPSLMPARKAFKCPGVRNLRL